MASPRFTHPTGFKSSKDYKILRTNKTTTKKKRVTPKWMSRREGSKTPTGISPKITPHMRVLNYRKSKGIPTTSEASVQGKMTYVNKKKGDVPTHESWRDRKTLPGHMARDPQSRSHSPLPQAGNEDKGTMMQYINDLRGKIELDSAVDELRGKYSGEVDNKEVYRTIGGSARQTGRNTPQVSESDVFDLGMPAMVGECPIDRERMLISKLERKLALLEAGYGSEGENAHKSTHEAFYSKVADVLNEGFQEQADVLAPSGNNAPSTTDSVSSDAESECGEPSKNQLPGGGMREKIACATEEVNRLEWAVGSYTEHSEYMNLKMDLFKIDNLLCKYLEQC